MVKEENAIKLRPANEIKEALQIVLQSEKMVIACGGATYDETIRRISVIKNILAWTLYEESTKFQILIDALWDILGNTRENLGKQSDAISNFLRGNNDLA